MDSVSLLSNMIQPHHLTAYVKYVFSLYINASDINKWVIKAFNFLTCVNAVTTIVLCKQKVLETDHILYLILPECRSMIWELTINYFNPEPSK